MALDVPYDLVGYFSVIVKSFRTSVSSSTQQPGFRKEFRIYQLSKSEGKQKQLCVHSVTAADWVNTCVTRKGWSKSAWP